MDNILSQIRFTTVLPSGEKISNTRFTSVKDNKLSLHITQWWDPIKKSLTYNKPTFDWLPYFYEK